MSARAAIRSYEGEDLFHDDDGLFAPAAGASAERTPTASPCVKPWMMSRGQPTLRPSSSRQRLTSLLCPAVVKPASKSLRNSTASALSIMTTGVSIYEDARDGDLSDSSSASETRGVTSPSGASGFLRSLSMLQ